MNSKKAGVLWSFRDDEMPNSLSGLVQMYSDETATSPKRHAALAYPLHLLYLNLNAKQRKYLRDHGETLLGFFLAGSGEMQIERGNGRLQKSLSRSDFTASEAALLQTDESHTSSSISRKERVSVQSMGSSFSLEARRDCTSEEFEVTLKEENSRRCFPKAL